ncbi:MAG: Omp28-related outer membrane protein [Saprospiraceae bacterium]|nr:Omp28-related outer membrane protein [Bacteroidia bacterium]MBT8230379.1 Omp28-related outer membrane protein [Bacteroidia bacterium]NNF22499.1 Omp28-related outer membrane protein [Saprospiraceae bacterium]NNK89495.1 Omp28-related outer membrane protein [Saprospiraceae bacterium]
MKRYLLSIMTLVFSATMMFAQVLVEENFNGTLPMDWSVETSATDGGWVVGSSASLGSQFWPVSDPEDGTTFIATNDDACNCDKSSDRLIMPAVDLSMMSGAVFLNFDIAYAQGTYGVAEALFLDVSYDGGTTWEQLTEITGDGSILWRSAVYNVSDAVGNASVNFSFRYTDNGGWLFGAALDNVVLRVPSANDVRLELDNIYRFTDVATPLNVSGSIVNVGGQNLTQFDVVINDGSNTITETVTGVDVGPLESTDFSIPVTLAEPTNFDVTIDIQMPNGVADEDASNNGARAELTGVLDPPGKQVFVEESTGTWCPWCPRGAVFMDLMEENFAETFAGAAIHVGQSTWPDPMEVSSYAQEYVGLVSGFPTLVVDRSANPGIPGIDDMITFGEDLRTFTRNRPSPIGLSLDAQINMDTREMVLDLAITAHSNIDANYSVAVLITEDHVVGDSFDYRQANNYAGGGQGPMGGWENLANPASGGDIEYNHTLRGSVGGFYGDATLVPATITAGETYTHTLSYMIPADHDMTKLNAIAVVLDNDNESAAYNAYIEREIPFMTSSVEEIDELAAFEVYPNPTESIINLELGFTENVNYNVSITDVLGNKVKDLGSYSLRTLNENYNVSDLASGMYFITIQTEIGQNVLKFTKL